MSQQLLDRPALDLLGHLRELDSHGVRFVAVTQGIDVRPGGDPMSRILLTMLAAVAEFERDLIRDRTRAGLARARRDGRRLGRPRARRPDAAEVADLRAAGRTWAEVASELGCTVWAARQGQAEAAKPAGRGWRPRAEIRPLACPPKLRSRPARTGPIPQDAWTSYYPIQLSLVRLRAGTSALLRYQMPGQAGVARSLVLARRRCWQRKLGGYFDNVRTVVRDRCWGIAVSTRSRRHGHEEPAREPVSV